MLLIAVSRSSASEESPASRMSWPSVVSRSRSDHRTWASSSTMRMTADDTSQYSDGQYRDRNPLGTRTGHRRLDWHVRRLVERRCVVVQHAKPELLDPVAHLVAVDVQQVAGTRLVPSAALERLHEQLALHLLEI